MAALSLYPNVKTVIYNFLSVVMEQEIEQDDIGVLIALLDELAYIVRFTKDHSDEIDYPDPPETDYPAIGKVLEKRFPSLGWYNMVFDISGPEEEAELGMYSSSMNLMDIVASMQEIVWRFENTSDDDAYWHFHWGYMATWGRDLRFLQLYLHDRWW